MRSCIEQACCRRAGHAGQSLGAWLARGVFLDLEGDSNDYVGKVGHLLYAAPVHTPAA